MTGDRGIGKMGTMSAIATGFGCPPHANSFEVKPTSVGRFALSDISLVKNRRIQMELSILTIILLSLGIAAYFRADERERR